MDNICFYDPWSRPGSGAPSSVTFRKQKLPDYLLPQNCLKNGCRTPLSTSIEKCAKKVKEESGKGVKVIKGNEQKREVKTAVKSFRSVEGAAVTNQALIKRQRAATLLGSKCPRPSSISWSSLSEYRKPCAVHFQAFNGLNCPQRVGRATSWSKPLSRTTSVRIPLVFSPDKATSYASLTERRLKRSESAYERGVFPLKRPVRRFVDGPARIDHVKELLSTPVNEQIGFVRQCRHQDREKLKLELEKSFLSYPAPIAANEVPRRYKEFGRSSISFCNSL